MINILGMGPGHRDYIAPIALQLIYRSDVLIGGKRLLNDYCDKGTDSIVIGNNLKEVMDFIIDNQYDKEISVLLSGDTGYYSMLNYIKRYIQDESVLNVIPGISSFQYLFAKLKKTWQDTYLGSVHGRELDYVGILKDMGSVTLLTDNKENSPSNIAKVLMDNNLENAKIYVGESLSYDDEKITIGSPREIMSRNFGMSVVVIEHE